MYVLTEDKNDQNRIKIAQCSRSSSKSTNLIG